MNALAAEREAYLTGEPVDDARFAAGFAHALEHTGGYRPEEAKQVVGTMLPEILPYDPTARRHSQTTAAHSPTTLSMPSWLSSQMER